MLDFIANLKSKKKKNLKEFAPYLYLKLLHTIAKKCDDRKYFLNFLDILLF